MACLCLVDELQLVVIAGNGHGYDEWPGMNKAPWGVYYMVEGNGHDYCGRPRMNPKSWNLYSTMVRDGHRYGGPHHHSEVLCFMQVAWIWLCSWLWFFMLTVGFLFNIYFGMIWWCYLYISICSRVIYSLSFQLMPLLFKFFRAYCGQRASS